MKVFALLLILFSSAAFAREGGGVAFQLGFGSGGATIENPDETKAGYKILSATGRVLLPLIETSEFSAALTGAVRYLDLTNTANNSEQSEVANMLGPGAGLRLQAWKFFASYEYDLMAARHYTIGSNSKAIKYSLPLGTMEAGIAIPFKQLSVSFSYSRSSGEVPKSGTGLSKDVRYQDEIYWLQFTYSTGADFGKFLNFLF